MSQDTEYTQLKEIHSGLEEENKYLNIQCDLLNDGKSSELSNEEYEVRLQKYKDRCHSYRNRLDQYRSKLN